MNAGPRLLHSTVCIYTTVQKVLGRFEVSKDVYVKSFQQHAFDPLLSNKTTDYYHEILYLKKYKGKVEVLHKLISILLQCLDMH